jgi:hypothetical protein
VRIGGIKKPAAIPNDRRYDIFFAIEDRENRINKKAYQNRYSVCFFQ